MSLIQKYNELKQLHAQAKRYFDVFDQPGHMNALGKVVNAEVSKFTVYHQAYAGANNYHEAEKWLRDEIGAAVVDLGPNIRRLVMMKLEARMVAAAEAARKEAQAVLDAVKPAQPEEVSP